jgi:TPR repeat protein
LQQDLVKGVKLWTQAAELGSSKAHYHLGKHYYKGGDLTKAKFHYESAAIAGHEVARCNIGVIEAQSENNERAVKHLIIAASAGDHTAMVNLLVAFRRGHISRDAIDSTLAAYNNSCAEMRSEARDARIRMFMENNC